MKMDRKVSLKPLIRPSRSRLAEAPITWAIAVGSFIIISQTTPAARGADEADFRRDVAPLLRQHCLRCHNSEKMRGELDLSSAATAIQGGLAGPVIVPNKPDESLLLKRVINGSMPPQKDGRRLTPDEVQSITRWIQAGAKWPDGVVLTVATPVLPPPPLPPPNPIENSSTAKLPLSPAPVASQMSSPSRRGRWWRNRCR